ncbi:MAG: AAA family ATPase [Pseudomonadota bacterium]
MHLAPQPHRRLIGVVGPPASGKSTLAATLAQALDAHGAMTSVVPMDGFHLDDRLLEQDGTASRKGAPHTFDTSGFLRLIKALQSRDPVVYPIFDRSREIAIAGAGRVPATCDTVVVEGNYLLLKDEAWARLHPLWTFTIALHPPVETLIERLRARWDEHGKSDAARWIETNDLPNIETVMTRSVPADVTWTES